MDKSTFLHLASQVFDQIIPPEPGVVTAARLGEVLRRSVAEAKYNDFGYRNFRELLMEFERSGKLVITQTARGALAVARSSSPRTSAFQPLNALTVGLGLTNWNAPPLPAVSMASSTTMPKPMPVRSASPIPPHDTRLRSRPWVAFTNPRPPGRRFIDRRTGAVRMGLTDVPYDPGEWIEVKPIEPAAQRTWAELFLRQHGLIERVFLRDANDPKWYGAFFHGLQEQDGALTVAWNRYKTELVSKHAEKWALENGVPRELLFGRSLDQRIGEAEGSNGRYNGAESALRRQIVNAVNRMSVDDLLELKIRVKYLVSAQRNQ